jgi:hypothetical protein
LQPFKELTLKKVRADVTAAIKQKREIQSAAAEHRAKWLERMAQEVAAQKPGSDWEKILKGMITAARQKATNKRLSAIFRPEWSNLDYIEVPNEKWFLTDDGSELFEFSDGIFVAHPQIEDMVFDKYGVIKVLPENTYIVDVEQTNEAIFVQDPTSVARVPPNWITIDDTEEVQKWLMKRNKRHLKQLQIEQRPPTTDEFKHILAEHGTSKVADAILDGTYDPTELGMGKEMEEFLKELKRSNDEAKLTTPERMSAEAFVSRGDGSH